MGFVVKSALGLGTVYFLMFSPTAEHVAQNPAVPLCAHAATAQLRGDESWLAEVQTARCLTAISQAAPPLRLRPAEPLVPAPAPKAPAAPVAPLGTLTQADLAAPWAGPGELSRKSSHRG